MLYADLARRIKAAGGRVVVDSHDEALRYAIEAKPFLIKPNCYELETLLGCSLESTEVVAAFARDAAPQQALRLAVACTTGTVSQSGTELFSGADVDSYFDAIEMHCLDI